MKNSPQINDTNETSIDEEKRDFLFITTAGLAIAEGGALLGHLLTQ